MIQSEAARATQLLRAAPTPLPPEPSTIGSRMAEPLTPRIDELVIELERDQAASMFGRRWHERGGSRGNESAVGLSKVEHLC